MGKDSFESKSSGLSREVIGRRRFLKNSALAVAGTALTGSILAACGDNTATPATAATTAASATTAAGATTGGSTVTVTAAATGAPIKIGIIVPQTGAFTQQGLDVITGIQNFLDNYGSSVAGRPVQIIKEDEGSTPDAALQRTKKLTEQDKVDAIVGFSLTNDILAARDYINQSKQITLVAGAGANALSGDKFSKYIFRSIFANGQYTYPFGGWSFTNVGKKVAVITHDYAGGHEVIDGFKLGFTKAGGTVVKEAYTVLNQTTDFAPFLTQIQDAKPDFVFAFYQGTDSLNFIKQYTQFGLKQNIPLTGNLNLDEATALPQMGDTCLDIKHVLGWTPQVDNDLTRKLVADYAKKYNKVPNLSAIFGADGVHMFLEAVKSLNGDTSDKDKLIAAIEKVKIDSARGAVTIDAGTHGITQDLFAGNVVKNADGKLTIKQIAVFPQVPDINVILKQQ